MAPDLGRAFAGAGFATGDDDAAMPLDGAGGDEGKRHFASGAPGIGGGVVGEYVTWEAGVRFFGLEVGMSAIISAEDEQSPMHERGGAGGGHGHTW